MFFDKAALSVISYRNEIGVTVNGNQMLNHNAFIMQITGVQNN